MAHASDYIASRHGKLVRSYSEAAAMLKRLKCRERLKAKNQKTRSHVAAYRCRVCRGWHIGSTDKD